MPNPDKPETNDFRPIDSPLTEQEKSTSLALRSHGHTWRVAITLLLIAVVAISWSGVLEERADSSLQSRFERALITAAIARGLNGIISVAQGTEIAIQPVGVGVTITVGEILDPLNDLIERFSWMALAAAASIGTQLLLTEIFAEPLINVVVSLSVAVYLVVIWWPRALPGTGFLLRLAALTIFLRFVFTTMTLTVGWIDRWVLEERQQQAITELTTATSEIEAMRAIQPEDVATDQSLLQRLESILDDGRQVLDIDAQLDSLQANVESSITHLVDLMVVFLVQTLMLPIGALWLSVVLFRRFWHWTEVWGSGRSAPWKY